MLSGINVKVSSSLFMGILRVCFSDPRGLSSIAYIELCHFHLLHPYVAISTHPGVSVWFLVCACVPCFVLPLPPTSVVDRLDAFFFLHWQFPCIPTPVLVLQMSSVRFPIVSPCFLVRVSNFSLCYLFMLWMWEKERLFPPPRTSLGFLSIQGPSFPSTQIEEITHRRNHRWNRTESDMAWHWKSHSTT